MKLKNNKGFTLIEILIVLVVLGALLGLALPAYQSSVEKSRKSEALLTLLAVKSAEVRYYAQNGKYTGTDTLLDFVPPHVADANPDASGQTRHFNYVVTDPSGIGTSFKVTATRNASDGGNGTSTVIVDNTGAVSGTM